MPEYKYTILLSDHEEIAQCHSLDHAVLFVETLFEKWYAEPELKISIKRKIKGETDDNTHEH